MLKDVSHISLDTNIVHWVHTTGVMRVGIRQTEVRRSVTVVGAVRVATQRAELHGIVYHCHVEFDKAKFAES